VRFSFGCGCAAVLRLARILDVEAGAMVRILNEAWVLDGTGLDLHGGGFLGCCFRPIVMVLPDDEDCLGGKNCFMSFCWGPWVMLSLNSLVAIASRTEDNQHSNCCCGSCCMMGKGLSKRKDRLACIMCGSFA